MSIVIPVYNEAPTLGHVLDDITALQLDAEIVVVNDGSTDNSAEVAEAHANVRVVSHPYNIGNGAAVKRGIRAARGKLIVLMDGDGQHSPADIPAMLAHAEQYDMVVGARNTDSDTAVHRDAANRLYNSIANYLVGRPVRDLTSGFRVIRATVARQFVNLLPNGFSYPTTITIALSRAGYSIHYEPITVQARRTGTSKIRLLRDGPGFLLTLLRVGTLFVPLKIFLPVVVALFAVGIGYGASQIIFRSRFSEMAGLLVLSGILLFMLGLISEQIALLRMAQARSLGPRDESE